MSSKIIYHRGDENNAPANTILAFEQAAKGDGDGVELDVQFTEDNELVVFHDQKIDNHTKGSGYVSDYSLSELKKIKLETGSTENGEQYIPTLEETLAVVENMDMINIELKQRDGDDLEQEKKLVQALAARGLEEKTLVTSFNHYTIHNLHEIAPDIKKGILYYSRLYRPWDYARQLGADHLIPMHRTVTEKMLSGAHRNGLKVAAYGTNDHDRIEKLIELGVDMIITDEAEAALSLREELTGE
ncbi:glycerophosphodiester phosphodiesterase [Halarsenatibacter silvermanii]|uniref:Glycerophosphoryl diester phosphodiesterase n=1 Tax=Halarsenatibacter silvermanii TaxID=321763 RepID=A0A1G9H9V2_9FIRM|nr:glycerophosphodiester phosphodiesterase family protein [Halarsenatibacter silvermanii]SDL09690.1 glycerophosphoryl diester phosphodiesterase [Halarsenatibacter silvermanii]